MKGFNANQQGIMPEFA